MASEGLEIEIYRYSDPITRVTTLDGRQNPKFLSELTGVGGGSINIPVSDPKVIADPTLIDSRNIVKCRNDGVVTGAFIIGSRKSVIIGAGETSVEAKEIAGEGLKTWFNDAIVLPYAGLKRLSFDKRSFNFASEQGSWYVPANWVTPLVYGQVFATPVYGEGPSKWPEADTSKWLLSQALVNGINPEGTSYFRYEFTTAAEANYAIYVAADDNFTMYLDGALITSSTSSSFTDATRIEVALSAGSHILAFSVYNIAQATGNPQTLLAAMYSVIGTGEAKIFGTGDAGWKTLPFPATAPGWTAAEVLLKLISEANTRGVIFPTVLVPTFTATTDSNGVAWTDKLPWDFEVGSSLASVVAKMEELVCKLWITPGNYNLNMVIDRGNDRSIFVYDVDGITPVSTPVVFEKGKNLRGASTQSKGKIVNALAIKSANGWITQQELTSKGKYGTVEGTFNTGASSQVATRLSTRIFSQSAKEEEGATYEIFPTDKKPYLNYEEGDWVLAPDERGLQQRRRIMSISTEESNSGQALYSLEFDTVFQDNTQRLNDAISKLGGSGAGGSYSNASGGTSLGDPIIISPPTSPSTTKIPKSPINVAATSTGLWSPDGVTPYSEVTVTWDAVTQNTDGSAAIPTFYEVWGHLTSAADSAYMAFATVTSPIAVIRPFTPGTNWTFKVLARTNDRFSAFSVTTTHLTVGPTTPLVAPSIPILSSNKGVLIVNWDGLLTGSIAPPPQFRYVYATVATSLAGTYTRMGGALQRDGRSIYISGLVVGTAYWVKLVATDGAGIASASSSAANTTLTGIDLGDLNVSISNSIEAARIAGLTARSMNNMLNGGGFEENDPTLWSIETANVTNVTTTPYVGTRALQVKASTAAYTASRYGLVLEVIPGETYQYAGWYRALGTGSSIDNAVVLSVEYGATPTTLTSNVDIATSNLVSSTYLYMSGSWLVPIGVYFVRPRIVMSDLGNVNQYLVDEQTFRMVIPSELIVDGAIVAGKLAAGSVVAGKIAADAVVAANIQAGAITAGKIAVGVVTALELSAGSVTADKVAAGSITALKLSAEVGKNLDISSNNAVTIIAGNISTVTNAQNATAASLQSMQTYYTFGPSGAIVSTPSSPFAVRIANDRIEMLQLGNPVSYWTAGQMFVNSLVGTEVILGNHKLEKYTTGTVVRAL